MENSTEYQEACKKGFEAEHDFLENFICDEYDNRFIEYPIEVSKINFANVKAQNAKSGILVRIRPCEDKYEGKTYLGLYLGDLATRATAEHSPKTKELNINFVTNPAIFVFDLKKIIFGYESWWGIIESEEELKKITDQDIDNIWYVKALNALNQAEKGD